MSNIDLSKAKIGDKFRTKSGRILEYYGENLELKEDKYELIDEQGFIKHFHLYGNYLTDKENELDLIGKVPDNPLDLKHHSSACDGCGRKERVMKEKCVCEWLREQECSVDFEECQELQFKDVEIAEDDEIRMDIEYLPSLKTWRIATYCKNNVVDFAINYCPFCGRKLN